MDESKAYPARGTLRGLATLLTYPDRHVRSVLAEVRAVMWCERALSLACLEELDRLIVQMNREDPYEVESRFVETFDRGRSTSLHLFEHVHGDSRDRGPAMIDLARTYEQAGLYLAEGELPDYLPVVLEFVSTQPSAQAQEFLGEFAHLLGVIAAGLRKRRSPYLAVLAALLELAKVPQTEPTESTDEPLDESWAEPEVFQGCSVQGQAKPQAPMPIHFMPRHASNRPSRNGATGVES